MPPWPRVLAALGGLLLFFVIKFVIGLSLLLLSSLCVVYVTGLVARRLGLPELHVTLAFLGLLAVVVGGFVGARIGFQVAAGRKRLERAIEEAGERIANEVNASAAALTSAIDELPAVVVDAGIVLRDGEERVGVAVTHPHGGGFPRKKSPSRRGR